MKSVLYYFVSVGKVAIFPLRSRTFRTCEYVVERGAHTEEKIIPFSSGAIKREHLAK